MAKSRTFVCIILILYLIQFLSTIPVVSADTLSGGTLSAPAVENYYVTPTVGDELTVFTYYASFNYSSTYPRNVQVKIDGKNIFNMTWSDENKQNHFTYEYSTKLGAGNHNFTILYNDYYTNWTTQYETNVKWDPTVYRNEAYLNQTSSNTTKLACSLDVNEGFINASVEGDLIGTVDLSDLEIVIINKTAFDGKGFATANWDATIETNPYNGTWKGMIYYKPGERKYYLKGTVDGGLKGLTEGYLTESVSNSGTFDVYNSTWTICKLGDHYIYADLLLNGTVNYSKSGRHASSIYIVQASFSGVASGYYNKSLSVVLTHVRVDNGSGPYYGQGFSIMSYNTVNGTGMGRTVDNNSSKAVTTLNGYFTEPLFGIITGKLNESGKNKTLYIYFYRIKLDSPPRAKLIFNLWGPGRASPGQTINYTIKYYNYGLKGVYNVGLELQLPSNSKLIYISNSGGGTYNATTDRIYWTKDLPPESSGYLNVKCKVKWGVAQNTILNFYLYINITELTLVSHHKTLVTTARDPNIKEGPESNVIPGQKLDYKIEYENEGKGIAFGVYFTDTLDEDLDDSTMNIGPVKSTKDNSQIAPAGLYDPATRTITWFVGEVGPSEGGYADLSINVRNSAANQAVIINYATVYFPSVPEETKTNAVISTVRIPQAPSANAGKYKVVKTLEDVNFDASLSTDADGTITSYAWDLGDGNSGSGKTVTHQYSDDGTYTVKLTVEDNDGLADSHEIIVYVHNRLPVAALSCEPLEVTTNEGVTFSGASSSDLDGSIAEFYFDFGDGSNSGWVVASQITHQYDTGGKTYKATLKVKDDDGGINSEIAECEVNVLNRKPTAKLTAVPVGPNTYEDVTFSASLSTDVDGTISQYYFDFGDGQTSGWTASPTVKHQYKDGTMDYTASVRVKDDVGSISALTYLTIQIQNREPTANIGFGSKKVNTFEDATFDASGSTDTDGTISQYYFDYGDGSNSGWQTTPKAIHQFTDGPVEYNVALTVRDDDGDTDTVTTKFVVHNRLPVAEAGEDRTTFASAPLSFDASGSSDIDGSVVEYLWDFGDGDGSSGSAVTHKYSDDGIYKVVLTVTDDDGEKGSDTCTIIAKNYIPIASFTVTPDAGDTATEFAFESTSYDLDGTLAKFTWDFGDGETASDAGEKPTHTYGTAGKHAVTLVVQDDDGGNSIGFTQIITVTDPKPELKISVSTSSAEIGEDISFDASGPSEAERDDMEFSWDFGDDGTGTGPEVTHAYQSEGTYTVTLTVTYGDNTKETATVDVVITEKPDDVDTSTSADDKRSNRWVAYPAIILMIGIMLVIFMLLMRRKKDTE